MRKVACTIALFIITAFPTTAPILWASSYTIEQITFDSYNHWETSINNNNEIVWLEFRNAGGTDRAIVSDQRGTLVEGMTIQHPFLSNNGDLVWDQIVNDRKQVFLNGTQYTKAFVHHVDPSINSLGELVWWEWNGSGQEQIFSNIRGQITFGETTSHYDPNINDLGEILWGESSPSPYRIMSNEQGLIAAGPIYRNPSANNDGQIIWSGQDGDERSIFSNFAGKLDLGEGYQNDASINDAGVISYTQLVDGYYQVFRATPVDPIPEPATILLVGIGLAGVAGIRRKMKSHRSA
ncbi:hypothetical protein D3OALGA1CA_1986 [Olavius algarvensis associated proteobacterium Delta 3]|nr:hypothetical protein D3OALGA1CA_1986 [Olavius algarvensis associated proteobacterium Delta 3]CAB5119330.1 hypothetical protein D3OALGB2SA_2880 [Olavius algarvensis associated proteobacterium Delta 3]